jgi:hypothetical protein
MYCRGNTLSPSPYSDYFHGKDFGIAQGYITSQLEWNFELYGFAFGATNRVNVNRLVVPFWSAVLPLTLLSAYLLLAKPQPAKTPTLTPSTEPDHA